MCDIEVLFQKDKHGNDHDLQQTVCWTVKNERSAALSQAHGLKHAWVQFNCQLFWTFSQEKIEMKE